MVSFENFVKWISAPSLSELKVTPSFCFPFKIPDDPTTSSKYLPMLKKLFSYLVLMAKRGLVTWLTRTLILFGLTLSEHCFGFCCPLSQKEGPLTDLLQVGTEIVLLNLGLISHIFRVWKLSRIFSLFYCFSRLIIQFS